MRTILSIILLVFASTVSNPGAQAETTVSTFPEQNTQDGITSQENVNLDTTNETKSIEFKLILDKKFKKINGFKIAYKITYDDHYFKRSETCKIVVKDDKVNSEFICFGYTKYHKIDPSAIINNITNHDKYTYSSDGFEHSFSEYENGDYSRLYDTFEVSNLVPRENVLQTQEQNRIAKKLEYSQNGNNELFVILSVNVADFSLVRREKFSIKDDDGIGDSDFHCDGDIQLTDREYIQNEEFAICRNIGFLYSNTEIDTGEDEEEDYDEEE